MKGPLLDFDGILECEALAYVGVHGAVSSHRRVVLFDFDGGVEGEAHVGAVNSAESRSLVTHGAVNSVGGCS